MIKILTVLMAVLCLVSPLAAQVDPKGLVGVWEGNWHMRTSERQYTGPMTVTIEKVENGKVFGKTESTNIRGENTPPVTWSVPLTDTGWSIVNREGFPTTVTVEGTKMQVITTRGASTLTATLIKKK